MYTDTVIAYPDRQRHLKNITSLPSGDIIYNINTDEMACNNTQFNFKFNNKCFKYIYYIYLSGLQLLTTILVTSEDETFFIKD